MTTLELQPRFAWEAVLSPEAPHDTGAEHGERVSTSSVRAKTTPKLPPEYRRAVARAAARILTLCRPEAERKHTEHLSFLERVQRDKTVPPSLATKARRIWLGLRAATALALPIPAASAMTGGPITYTWSNGRHQVSIEILNEEPCEWFYFDRETEAIVGGEDKAEWLQTNTELMAALSKIITA